MSHHDDFHMGAELELYIHLLLAFHDFLRVFLSNMNILWISHFISLQIPYKKEGLSTLEGVTFDLWHMAGY